MPSPKPSATIAESLPGTRRPGPAPLALLAFLILVPGYFFYHWLVGLNTIPQFLGGYVNESSVLAILLILVLLGLKAGAGSLRSFRLHPLELAYGAFMIYFIATVAYQAFRGGPPEVVKSHTASILQSLAIFAVYRATALELTFTHRLHFWLCLAMSAFVYAAVSNDVLAAFLVNADDAKAATYQGLAHAFFLSVCAVTPFSKTLAVRLLLYVNALVVLFFLGSRSDMLALFLFILIFEWVRSKNWTRQLLIYAGAVGLILLLIPWLLAEMPDNRILGLLEFKADTSVQVRTGQIKFALDQIRSSPFTGAYGSYMSLGGSGHYAHNALSAWVDLGLPGMLLLVAVVGALVYSAVTLAPRIRQRGGEHVADFGLALGFLGICLFFLTFSKPFVDISVPAAIGLFVRLHRNTEATGRHPGPRGS